MSLRPPCTLLAFVLALGAVIDRVGMAGEDADAVESAVARQP